MSLKGADGKDGIDGKDGADGKDGITPDLSDYLKAEDFTAFEDSTQYQFQTQSETILSLENRIIMLESQLSGTTTVTIFSACENALTLYGSELYTIYMCLHLHPKWNCYSTGFSMDTVGNSGYHAHFLQYDWYLLFCICGTLE